MQSLVIVDSAPKKTREERIVESQVRVGDKDIARNRRIFGSLMGTLKKFQQEQNHRAPTDDRQNEIRKKLEEKETAEKREAQRARRELFWDRKRRAAVVKFLETKVDIVKRFHEWEASQKPLLNFIRTEGPLPIYYMPTKTNKAQEDKWERGKKVVLGAIQTRREHMESQLRRLDQKIEYMTRPKQSGQEVEDDIEETKKRMQEEPVDDIDVDALLDDTEVEGLELVAIEESAGVAAAVSGDSVDGEANTGGQSAPDSTMQEGEEAATVSTTTTSVLDTEMISWFLFSRTLVGFTLLVLDNHTFCHFFSVFVHFPVQANRFESDAKGTPQYSTLFTFFLLFLSDLASNTCFWLSLQGGGVSWGGGGSWEKAKWDWVNGCPEWNG